MYVSKLLFSKLPKMFVTCTGSVPELESVYKLSIIGGGVTQGGSPFEIRSFVVYGDSRPEVNFTITVSTTMLIDI